MKTMQRIGIGYIIIFVFCLSISIQADGSKVIIAEGRASLANVDLEIARERAINNALRAAVEEGAGLFLTSQSVTHNFKLLSDNILAKSTGYVSEYKIISEKQEKGFYHINISALVKTEDIEQDLHAIGLLLERKNLPRLVLLIKESWQTGSTGKDLFAHQSQAEALAESAFLEKGFFVIDSQTVKKSREREQTLLAIKGNAKAAAVLGRLHEAELVILGEAISQSRGTVAGSNFISVSTTITIKVINSDTAEILATKSWNSSGAGLDELAASNSSIKRGMDKACQDLITDLLNKWARGSSGGHAIEIIIYQIRSLSDLIFLEKMPKNQHEQGIHRSISVISRDILCVLHFLRKKGCDKYNALEETRQVFLRDFWMRHQGQCHRRPLMWFE